jgi:hypothetical protein
MIPSKPTQSYIPRVYGFKVNQSSLFYKNHEDGPQLQPIEGPHRQNRRSRQRQGRRWINNFEGASIYNAYSWFKYNSFYVESPLLALVLMSRRFVSWQWIQVRTIWSLNSGWYRQRKRVLMTTRIRFRLALYHSRMTLLSAPSDDCFI